MIFTLRLEYQFTKSFSIFLHWHSGTNLYWHDRSDCVFPRNSDLYLWFFSLSNQKYEYWLDLGWRWVRNKSILCGTCAWSCHVSNESWNWVTGIHCEYQTKSMSTKKMSWLFQTYTMVSLILRYCIDNRCNGPFHSCVLSCVGFWMKVKLVMTLFCNKPQRFSYVNSY